MKILLINPAVEKKKVYGILAAVAPHLPPLGLCYLGAYARKKGHDVDILDFNMCSGVDIIHYVRHCRPDLIGVTATTISFSAAQHILRAIKHTFPAIITVIGGAHVSALGEEVMCACDDIDVAVLGEGEVTFCDVITHIETGCSLAKCRGILYRENGRIRKTENRNTITDLDILPFPDRTLLKNFDRYYHHFLRGTQRTVSMVTSRGCPCCCAFCTQSVFGTQIRGHSPRYICDEIQKVQEQWGAEFISFEDDFFNYDRKRLHAVCSEMIERKLDIRWGCSVRIDNLQERDIAMMHKAGCRTIYIGVESFTERIQTMINKRISMERLREKIAMIRQHDIHINASFMLGFPTETKEEMLDTIKNSRRLPIQGAFFCLYAPYPNTPLREVAKTTGELSMDWDDYSNHLSTIAYCSDTVNKKQLRQLLLYAYVHFYCNVTFVAAILPTIIRAVMMPFAGFFCSRRKNNQMRYCAKTGV